MMMSIEGAEVMVEPLVPPAIYAGTNNLVVRMEYQIAGRMDEESNATNGSTFTMYWAGLDPTRLFQEQGTVLSWLEELGVPECAWDLTIDSTLLGLEPLLEDLHNSDSPSNNLSLGLHVSIRVFDHQENQEQQDQDDEAAVADCKERLAASGVKFIHVKDSNVLVKDAGSCSICLQEFQFQENRVVDTNAAAAVAVLPCSYSHVFHDSCLVRWVVKCTSAGTFASCPLCRFPFHASHYS